MTERRPSDIDPGMHAARRALPAPFLASGLTLASFLSRVPSLQDDLGLAPATLGVVLAALPVGVVTGLLLAGRLIPRTGSRRLLRLGLSAAAPLLPIIGLAVGPLTLSTTLVLLGLSVATMDVAMNAQGVGVERAYGRSILVGMHAAWSVGTLLGALLGTIAIATATPVWLHLAGVGVVVAVLGTTAAGRLTIDDRATGHQRLRIALPRGPLLPLALIAFASILGESTAGQWAGIHLRDTIGAAGGRIGWGLVAHTTGMVIVRLTGDLLVGRWGRQVVIRTGALLAALGFLLLGTVPTLSASVLGFLLVGLGVGPLVPLAFAIAGRLGRTPGEGLAAVHAFGYLAFVTGPPTIGLLTDTVGLRAAFGVVALVIAVLGTRPLPTPGGGTPP